MAVAHQQRVEISKPIAIAHMKTSWHTHIVNIALLIIVTFQMVNLPGAILNKSIPAILITLLSLMLCSLVFFFHHRGNIAVVSVLLIVVVNLGCSLTLFTAPGGLDVGDLPVFDMLIVSELIAVFFLPARSVFLVALANALFTLVDITLQPHTAALSHFLTSGRGYTALAHPLSLQIIVAIATYIWVRRTQSAVARADRAEEIAVVRKREADRKHQLDATLEQISQILARAANGDRSIRIDVSQDTVLWRVGNLLNVLVTRLAKTSQVEQENLRLRAQVAQFTKTMKKASTSPQHMYRQSSK